METKEEIEKREKAEKALVDKINGEVKNLVEEYKKADAEGRKALEEKLAKAEKDLAEMQEKHKSADGFKYKEMTDTVKDLTEKVKALKEVAAQPKSGYKSIETQIREAITARKAEWDKFAKEKQGSFELELDMKAATTMTVAANAGSYVPFPELIPGLTDLARNKPFLENYVNKSNTASAKIVWMDKRTPEGNAGFIAEGVVKPLIDFNIVPTSSDAKKVADKIKVSTEMLEDIPFIEAEIRNELKYQIDIAVDTALLSGDGIGANLKGIDTYAGGYVLLTITTTDPNNADAIRAAAAQINSLNFQANYAFINPIDAANMDLTKANDSGVYMLPPFVTADGRKIGGVQIIETNQIPVGYLLIGDMTKYNVRDYKPFTIKFGWVNDDFEKNLVTIIGERRLHAYMSDNNTGAFIYDTFANIKTAIGTV
jgi:HK97 family phage major capsid protein